MGTLGSLDAPAQLVDTGEWQGTDLGEQMKLAIVTACLFVAAYLLGMRMAEEGVAEQFFLGLVGTFIAAGAGLGLSWDKET